MGLVPTVKVADDTFDRGYRIIAKKDYDSDEHTLYSERDTPDDESPYSYELASNGFWTVYGGGEEVAAGRGKDDLDIALADVGESRDSATRLD